jgi:hypothetical protein
VAVDGFSAWNAVRTAYRASWPGCRPSAATRVRTLAEESMFFDDKNIYDIVFDIVDGFST